MLDPGPVTPAEIERLSTLRLSESLISLFLLLLLASALLILSESFKKLTKPAKGYQFKPIEAYKPPKLSLSALKSKCETLLNWTKKMQEYCITGFSDHEALEGTPTISSVIKGCIENHVKQPCKVQLDAATTVKKMYTIFNEQEEIFWPPQK